MAAKPNIIEDFDFNLLGERFYSGFLTECQISEWFIQSLNLLKANDFRLAIWDTDEFYIGRSQRQITFVRKKLVNYKAI